MTPVATEPDELLKRWNELKSERSPWLKQWQDLSDYILPVSAKFNATDRSRAEDKPYNKIYDNTGTLAHGTLSAGMMAGMTSPARPWFKLETPDKALNKSHNVRAWMDDVTQLMLRVFARSNTYRMLHSAYEELGCYGTFATITQGNFKNVVHHHSLTAGEFAVATDYLGNVNTIYREFTKTVAAVVREFGLQACSDQVQALFRNGSLDKPVVVVHAIEPREDRDATKRDARNMAWRSTYFELGAKRGQYLRDSGFRQFPGLVGRWSTYGNDIYGNGPALRALGDVKGLQYLQERKAVVLEKITNPAMNAPAELKTLGADLHAGGINFVPMNGQTAGMRPVHVPDIDLQHLLFDIQDTRQRINSAFYRDVFLMLAQQPTSGSKMTAAEVAERHEEKLLMLGPTLERLHNEALAPLIETTFSHMVEADILPQPPQELHGVDLNVQFVSMLAQAQRAIGSNGVDRFVSSLGVIEQIKPGTTDKFDADQWVDAYADMLGVDPDLIVASEKVALVRDERAKKQAQAEQMAAMQAQADTAQKLAGANTGGKNALTDVMSGLTGYTSPTGV